MYESFKNMIKTCQGRAALVMFDTAGPEFVGITNPELCDLHMRVVKEAISKSAVLLVPVEALFSRLNHLRKDSYHFIGNLSRPDQKYDYLFVTVWLSYLVLVTEYAHLYTYPTRIQYLLNTCPYVSGTPQLSKSKALNPLSLHQVHAHRDDAPCTLQVSSITLMDGMR